jgi:hypothetical protein
MQIISKTYYIHIIYINIMNATIILTSTVNINAEKGVYQTDKRQRLDTYLKSILKWLQKTKFNIILVENSGYTFDELAEEKKTYKDRFEVVTFNESELPYANYLKGNSSKGACEVFAINYAFHNTTLRNKLGFIIKITARFFIDDLEKYLSQYDLNKFDCLTQFNRSRCEMVGSHIKNFRFIFNTHLVNKQNKYDGHIENIWRERTMCFKNNLRCRPFEIEPTQRGGIAEIYKTI